MIPITHPIARGALGVASTIILAVLLAAAIVQVMEPDTAAKRTKWEHLRCTVAEWSC